MESVNSVGAQVIAPKPTDFQRRGLSHLSADPPAPQVFSLGHRSHLGRISASYSVPCVEQYQNGTSLGTALGIRVAVRS